MGLRLVARKAITKAHLVKCPKATRVEKATISNAVCEVREGVATMPASDPHGASRAGPGRTAAAELLSHMPKMRGKR